MQQPTSKCIRGGADRVKGPSCVTTSVFSDSNKESATRGTHPFPDDKLPRLVVGVLENMKNSGSGRRRQFREKTHLSLAVRSKRAGGCWFRC